MTKLDLTKFVATQVARKENIERAIGLKKLLIEEYVEDLEISECVRGLCNHKQERKINFEISKDDDNIKIEEVEEFNVCMNGFLIYTVLMDIKYFEFVVQEINQDMNQALEEITPP
jgi:hypothetical protein